MQQATLLASLYNVVGEHTFDFHSCTCHWHGFDTANVMISLNNEDSSLKTKDTGFKNTNGHWTASNPSFQEPASPSSGTFFEGCIGELWQWYHEFCSLLFILISIAKLHSVWNVPSTLALILAFRTSALKGVPFSMQQTTILSALYSSWCKSAPSNVNAVIFRYGDIACVMLW